ncbi:MAG: polysaccharide deacetylase family protein [Candidatus Bathyarchaeales archaeon]
MAILVSLTFDDGNENLFTEYYPILEDFGFRATFYVITGLIGKRGMLNNDQLKELYIHGNEIGSHTHTHPNLTKIDTASLIFEFKKSKEILQDFKCDTVAYPYGYYDERSIYYAMQFYSSARGYSGKDYRINDIKMLDKYALKTISPEHFVFLHPTFQQGLAIFVFHGKFTITFDKIMWFIRNRRTAFLNSRTLYNLFRRITRINSKAQQCPLIRFKKLCDLLASHEFIEVLTISEALKKSLDFEHLYFE